MPLGSAAAEDFFSYARGILPPAGGQGSGHGARRSAVGVNLIYLPVASEQRERCEFCQKLESLSLRDHICGDTKISWCRNCGAIKIDTGEGGACVTYVPEMIGHSY